MGVVDLLIVIPATVGALMLLTNVGLSTFYKEKLGFAVNQTAEYVASLPVDQPMEEPARATLTELLTHMGLPGSVRNVQAVPTTISGRPAVSIVATAELNLLRGSFLPTTVTLQDRAVKMRNSHSYVGLVRYTALGVMRPVYVPVVEDEPGLVTYHPNLLPGYLNPPAVPGYSR